MPWGARSGTRPLTICASRVAGVPARRPAQGAGPLRAGARAAPAAAAPRARTRAAAIDVRLDLHPPLFSLGQIPRLTELHRGGGPPRGRPARRAASRPRLLAARHLRLRPRRLRGGHRLRRARPRHRRPDERPRASHHHPLPARHQPRASLGVASAPPRVPPPDRRRTPRRSCPSASSVCPRRPTSSACAWLAAAFAWLGRSVAAPRRMPNAAVHAADESDHPYAQAIAYTWRVYPVAFRGDVRRGPHAVRGRGPALRAEGAARLAAVRVLAPGLDPLVGGPARRGRALIERAVTLFEIVGIKAFLSLRYVEWAEGLLLADRVDDARRVALRAVELAVAHGERTVETWARCLLGETARASGEPGASVARSHYEQARALAEELGLPLLLARCHLGLGLLEIGRAPAQARRIRAPPTTSTTRPAASSGERASTRRWPSSTERPSCPPANTRAARIKPTRPTSPEYRATLVKLLADQARAELVAADTYSRWVSRAPSPDEKLSLAELAKEDDRALVAAPPSRPHEVDVTPRRGPSPSELAPGSTRRPACLCRG